MILSLDFLQKDSKLDAAPSSTYLSKLAPQIFIFFQQLIGEFFLLWQANTSGSITICPHSQINLSNLQIIGLYVESLDTSITPAHLLHFGYDILVDLVQFLTNLLLICAFFEVALLHRFLLGLYLHFSFEFHLKGWTDTLSKEIHNFFGIRFGRHGLTF